MTMKYWKVTLKCYSPVFIGSGDTYKKSQYLYDRTHKLVYFFRESKWVSFLWNHGITDDFTKELLEKLANFNLYDYVENQPVLKKKYGDFSHVLEALQRNGVVEQEREYLAVHGNNGKAPNDIARCQLDVEGNPYIPGSSLKGAFRTAILSHVIRQNRERYSREQQELKRVADRKRDMKRDMERVLNLLEKKLTIAPDKNGKLNMVNSYFRGLTVSDARLVKGGTCVVPKSDFSTYSWDIHVPALYREAIEKKSILEFTLGIDDSLKGMGHFGIYCFEDLQEILQEFVHFQYEILQNPFEKDMYAELSDIKDAQNADILLGGGTGFLSKTLIYSLLCFHRKLKEDILQLEKRDAVHVTHRLMEDSFRRGKHSMDREISPHTLKLVDVNEQMYLMGCCYLKGEPLC